jgi:tetratricopeptide (TPR) repeat protein
LETLDLNSQECKISSSDLNKIKTEITNNNNEKYYQAKALRSLGNILGIIGDIEQSKAVLLASLEISDNLDYNQEINKTLLNLGNVERAIALKSEEIRDFTAAENAQKNAFNYYQEVINLTSSSLLKIQAQLNQIELLIRGC